jgi:hypothetical protein
MILIVLCLEKPKHKSRKLDNHDMDPDGDPVDPGTDSGMDPGGDPVDPGTDSGMDPDGDPGVDPVDPGIGDEHGDEDMEFHDDGERWDPAEGRPDAGRTDGDCTPDNVASMKMAFGKTKKDFADARSFNELHTAMMKMEDKLNIPVFERCIELTMSLIEMGEKDFKVDGVYGCTEEPQENPQDQHGGGDPNGGGGGDHQGGGGDPNGGGDDMGGGGGNGEPGGGRRRRVDNHEGGGGGDMGGGGDQQGGSGDDEDFDPFPNSTDPCCKESLNWSDCCKTKDATMKRH